MAEWDTNIGDRFGIPLFEVAVYRVSPSRWRKENEKVRDSVRDFLGGGPPSDEFRESWERRFERVVEYENSQLGSYVYGQAIGWLRILQDGPGALIKGYSYLLPQKHFVRRFKQGRFENHGKEIERSFGLEIAQRNYTAIVSQLRRDIEATTQRGRVFHRRYLDLSAFDAVAPSIDWSVLLGDGVSPRVQ